MLIDAQGTEIPGCLLLKTQIHRDPRGLFQKTYHRKSFEEIGISDPFIEGYYSISKKNVVRGMHFQTPPAQHSKVVCCIHGRAFDVVLDIRKNSPTFRRYVTFNLDSDNGSMVYVPVGCAHGFMAMEDDTILSYQVSSLYSPSHDMGILWDSFNCDWPTRNAVVSDRDSRFPSLDSTSDYF